MPREKRERKGKRKMMKNQPNGTERNRLRKRENVPMGCGSGGWGLTHPLDLLSRASVAALRHTA